MKKLFCLFCLLIWSSLLFAQTEYLVRPNIADPLSGAPNNFHYIYTDQSLTQKNKLFLFFPGTGAVPFNYREILKHAANLGYHAVGLTYPNAEAINQICLTSTDITCHSRARLEVFDGTDRHADVSVDLNNCIKQRTLKLLEYLHANYPTENWGQYLNGSEIAWDKVIVSGHSQGGGHAGIISKTVQVERVAMFAAMDWIPLLNRNADWITWTGPTPDNKYYGFTHEEDEAVDFAKLQTTWTNYGMNAFGALVLVDVTSPPYSSTHQLYTQRSPANDPAQYHGSVVVDAYTPMAAGIPMFGPVWTYMIEGSEVPTSSDAEAERLGLTLYPNPCRQALSISGSDGTSFAFKIFAAQGQLLEFGNLSTASIDVSQLSPGVYVIQLYDAEKIAVARFVKE